MKIYRRIVVLCLFFVLIITGCGGTAGTETEEKKEGNTPLITSDEGETIPLRDVDILYEISPMTPKVLIDTKGYLPGSRKVGLFLGEGLEETFRLINDLTKEVVYEGEITNLRYDEELDVHVWYGDFSDYTTPGIYYIETAVIGQSYTFSIGEEVYDAFLQEIQHIFYYARCGSEIEKPQEYSHKICHEKETDYMTQNGTVHDVSGGWHTDGAYNKDVSAGARAITSLLFAYEMNPGAFGDSTGIPESGNGIPDIFDEMKYETDWLLKMIDVDSKGVYESVTREGSIKLDTPDKDYGKAVLGEISLEASADFAAAMSLFGRLYHEFDSSYADKCLYEAEQSYGYLRKNRQNLSDEYWYLVNTALFKTTGKNIYNQEVKEVFQRKPELIMQTDFGDASWNQVYLGSICYLTTNKEADVDICETLMSEIMNRAKNISTTSRTDPFLAEHEKNSTELAETMKLLGYSNCVISNKEYQTVIENHIHYITGRNEVGQSCIKAGGFGQKGQPEGEYYLLEDENMLYRNALLLFVLSNLEQEENLKE